MRGKGPKLDPMASGSLLIFNGVLGVVSRIGGDWRRGDAGDAGGSGTDAGALMAPSVTWSGFLEGDGDGGRDAEGSGVGAGAPLSFLYLFLPFRLTLRFATVSVSVSSRSGYLSSNSDYNVQNPGRGKYLFNDSWLRFSFPWLGRSPFIFLTRRLVYFTPRKNIKSAYLLDSAIGVGRRGF